MFSREGQHLSLLPEAGTFTRVSRYYMRACALRFCFVTLPAGAWVLFLLLYVWVYIRININDAWETFAFSHILSNWATAATI